MKLSARSRYAARLLLDLAQSPDETPVRAATLSGNTSISVQFIEQILRPLRQAGIIRSVRGAQGGHVMLKDPAEVTLGDVVRVMEGRISITQCCDDPETCGRADDCPTRQAWKHVSEVLERELDAITLADMMREPGTLLDDDGQD